ncbi:MAG: hypothetical protein ACYC3I_19475 [Gemmataceae bacterium]
MASEKEWVQSLHSRLNAEIVAFKDNEWRLRIDAGMKLAYAYEILQYNSKGPDLRHNARYETDLLLYDARENGDWIPRVVIECKKGGVTTNDALTYSAKAETHKRVHPYLRYGILVGDFGTTIPGRLIRHGAYFDFMMVWAVAEPTEAEWQDFVGVIHQEVKASRTLQSLLTENRSRGRPRFHLLHRPLCLKGLDES